MPTSPKELYTRGFIYVLLSLAGFWVLVSSPFDTYPYLTHLWGRIGVLAIGVMLLSTVGAATASFFGRYRIEMIFLPLPVAGVLSLGVLLLMTSPDHTEAVPLALLLFALALTIVLRYFLLMNLTRSATEEKKSTEKKKRV